MNKMRCCIIDDEPLACELIASYVQKTPFLQMVGKFGSAQDAVKTVMDGLVDMIFLDIHMPQLTGMEFARIVPDGCKIIFVTAYSDYAIEGFKVNAVDYLLKPVSYAEFMAAVTKAFKQYEMERSAQLKAKSKYIIVKSDYRMVQIDTDKILFVEGVKDYVKIYVAEDDKPVMTLMNLKTLEHTLPEHFMRVHRSYIVNTHNIRVIERNRIIFGKHYIPVSESYKPQFAEYVSRHFPAMDSEMTSDES